MLCEGASSAKLRKSINLLKYVVKNVKENENTIKYSRNLHQITTLNFVTMRNLLIQKMKSFLYIWMTDSRESVSLLLETKRWLRMF